MSFFKVRQKEFILESDSVEPIEYQRLNYLTKNKGICIPMRVGVT